MLFFIVLLLLFMANNNNNNNNTTTVATKNITAASFAIAWHFNTCPPRDGKQGLSSQPKKPTGFKKRWKIPGKHRPLSPNGIGRKGFTIEDGVQLRRRVTTRKRRRSQAHRREQTPGLARDGDENREGARNGNWISSDTSKDKNEHPIRDGVVAGSIAGSIADIFMYPFDTVNTRQKVKRGPTLFYRSMTYTAINILQKEGVKGWFGGVSAAAISALQAMQFILDPMNLLSHKVSRILAQAIGVESTTYLVAGALGELAASIVYTPFEVVKTRMQLGESWLNEGEASPRAYKGTFNAFQTILKNEGFLGLYSGYKACILTDCTYSALQFHLREAKA